MSSSAELFENDKGEIVVVYDRLASDWLGSRPNPDAIRRTFSCREEAILGLTADGFAFRKRYAIGYVCGESVKDCLEEFWEKR